MNNYIFLDIDGVLNSKQTNERGPYDNPGIENKHLDILKTIVDKTNGEIVLISDWRLSFLPDDHMPKMADYITEKFDSAGLSLSLVSANNRYENRVDEISEWIINHQTKGYIILDDNYLPGYEAEIIEPHWVQTDPHKGLEEKHVKEAITKMAIPVKQSSDCAGKGSHKEELSSEDKLIDEVTRQILEEHIEAFKELAKQE